MKFFCKACFKVYDEAALDCCPSCSGELFVFTKIYATKEEYEKTLSFKPFTQDLEKRIEALEQQVKNLDNQIYNLKMNNPQMVRTKYDDPY